MVGERVVFGRQRRRERRVRGHVEEGSVALRIEVVVGVVVVVVGRGGVVRLVVVTVVAVKLVVVVAAVGGLRLELTEEVIDLRVCWLGWWLGWWVRQLRGCDEGRGGLFESSCVCPCRCCVSEAQPLLLTQHITVVPVG